MTYSIKKKVRYAFVDAVAKVKAALAAEGFGVLTEIDVAATLKKKLNVDYDNYIILGACNPPFAYQALQAEKEIGLFLPCNVIVYEEKGGTFVSAILPSEAMGMIDNPPLMEIARQVEEKLKKAIEFV